VNFIRLPANDADSNEVADQVPELEDNDESLSAAGNRRHHAKSLSSAKEAHFREFEDRRQAANDEYTDEERAEWRRLHKEARRLHCDAFRTAGGFVAGAAFRRICSFEKIETRKKTESCSCRCSCSTRKCCSC